MRAVLSTRSLPRKCSDTGSKWQYPKRREGGGGPPMNRWDVISQVGPRHPGRRDFSPHRNGLASPQPPEQPPGLHSRSTASSTVSRPTSHPSRSFSTHSAMLLPPRTFSGSHLPTEQRTGPPLSLRVALKSGHILPFHCSPPCPLPKCIVSPPVLTLCPASAEIPCTLQAPLSATLSLKPRSASRYDGHSGLLQLYNSLPVLPLWPLHL